MLASMKSSEDPLKYLGIWENYVQCIQTSMLMETEKIEQDQNKNTQ